MQVYRLTDEDSLSEMPRGILIRREPQIYYYDIITKVQAEFKNRRKQRLELFNYCSQNRRKRFDSIRVLERNNPEAY